MRTNAAMTPWELRGYLAYPITLENLNPERAKK
jgi:hypothetical protein